MNEARDSIVEHTREMISGMLTLDSTVLSTPSDMWRENIARFEYLLSGPDMTPFDEIRLHTHFITGNPSRGIQIVDDMGQEKQSGPFSAVVNKATDAICASRHVTETLKRNVLFRKWLRGLNVPRRVIQSVSEPQALGGEKLLCTRIGGRSYNFDTSRFLTEIVNLYESGFLDFNQPGLRILDVGGGWGGLAYFLRRVFPNSHLTILDLPETMIFSIPYLKMVDKNKSFFVYGENGSVDSAISDNDFSFIPPTIINQIGDDTFDLVVNTGSMAEMTAEQVMEYIVQIKRVGKGLFFSFNEDLQSRNTHLRSLFQILREEFTVAEGNYRNGSFRPLFCTTN
jgi:hypothetical protein